MANHLDFLLALDQHVRASSLGVIQQGSELLEIAERAGLIEPGDQAPARWTGKLVALEFLDHGPVSPGDPRPLIRGAWMPHDIFRVSEYMVTPAGHGEAKRILRLRRDAMTDAAMAAAFPELVRPWMEEPERRAVSGPLGALRTALGHGDAAAAIGSAKNLVEASCKVILAREAVALGDNPSLPTLFKAASRCVDGEDGAASDLGRSAAATVQRLAELRNAAGAGHGHAAPPPTGPREAHLAASAACGISAYLLTAWL